MTDIEMKIEIEAEDFTEELSDEALDREGASALGSSSATGGFGNCDISIN